VVRSEPYEILILGAGIAGCALAYHLTRREVGPVAVYDPKTPAGGASGRAAGMVTEQLWNQWDVEVTRETHREYAELCHRWDPSAYQQNGFVRLTSNPEAVPVLQEAQDRLRTWGVEVEEASPTDLARWVPAGRFDDIVGALYGRHDACVTPSSVTTIYAEIARQAGATFDFGEATQRLKCSDTRWELTTPTRVLRSRRLVVAAGAWSKRILQSLGCPLPLVPYRTLAATLRPLGPRSDEFPTVHDIDLDVYVRPEGPNRILAGIGAEKAETDPDRFITGGDTAFLEHLADGLTRRFPGWAESHMIAAWAGVCTSTPDRRPLIGAVPNGRELFILAGFNGFGIMRAGGAARRLAYLLAEGDESDSSLAALRPVWPGRFGSGVRRFLPQPGFTLESGDFPRF
jgi:4-methylaminobutanoate oxidase (formaldehyde-forming)